MFFKLIDSETWETRTIHCWHSKATITFWCNKQAIIYYRLSRTSPRLVKFPKLLSICFSFWNVSTRWNDLNWISPTSHRFSIIKVEKTCFKSHYNCSILIIWLKTAIMDLFDWLICFIIKQSYDKLDASLKSGKDSFTARNDNQVFHSKSLAIIFMEVL